MAGKRATLQLKSAATPQAARTTKFVEVRPDREGTKLIGGHFPVSTWARLRHLAVDQQRTSQQLIEEALTDLFAKYES